MFIGIFEPTGVVTETANRFIQQGILNLQPAIPYQPILGGLCASLYIVAVIPPESILVTQCLIVNSSREAAAIARLFSDGPSFAKILTDLELDTQAFADTDRKALQHTVSSLRVMSDNVQLVSNGDFARWTAGETSPPDGWEIHWGAVERSMEQTKMGQYSLKTTNNVVRYRLEHPEQLRGKTLTFKCWVYATTNQPSVNTTIQIFDNLDTTKQIISVPHSENPGWEQLEVSHKVCEVADNVQLFLYVAGDTTSYFSGAMCRYNNRIVFGKSMS